LAVAALKLITKEAPRSDPWGSLHESHEKFPIIYDSEWEEIERHGGEPRRGMQRSAKVEDALRKIGSAWARSEPYKKKS
jgi:hypothetical protein